MSGRRSRSVGGLAMVGLMATSCGPASPPSAPPSDAPPTQNGRANLEVVNEDFQGQSAVSIISHESEPITVSRIVINDGRDASCVFDTGAALYQGWELALPAKVLPGQSRRTEFYSPKACGEPTAVTITTDLGIATYPVADPDLKALANGISTSSVE